MHPEPPESTYWAHWVNNLHRAHWVKPSPRCILSPPNLLTETTEATYRAYWIKLPRTHRVKPSPQVILSPLNQLAEPTESTYGAHWINLWCPLSPLTENTLSKAVSPGVSRAHKFSDGFLQVFVGGRIDIILIAIFYSSQSLTVPKEPIWKEIR